MADPTWRKNLKLLDFHKTGYLGIFDVVDYESGARFAKFEMADPTSFQKIAGFE